MSIQELSNLISSSITFKTITPMIPVMFYFLGTQTKYQDIKETIENKITILFTSFRFNVILFQVMRIKVEY